MKGRAYWYGPELEGRLVGVPTVFIRSMLPPDVAAYAHWYFPWEATRDQRWDWMRQGLARPGGLITVEVYPEQWPSVPADIRRQAHMQLRLPCAVAAQLKSTDTVCLELAPYTTWCVTPAQCLATGPADYGIDTSPAPYEEALDAPHPA